MKSILIILFVVLLASGAQARHIPADSLFDYYKNVQGELDTHVSNFRQVGNSLQDQGHDFDVVVDIHALLIRAHTHMDNIFNFFRLAAECDNVDLTHLGIDRNCVALANEIGKLQLYLSYTEHQLTAVQGNDAKKLLEQILVDFVDSIEDDEWREETRLRTKEALSRE